MDSQEGEKSWEEEDGDGSSEHDILCSRLNHCRVECSQVYTFRQERKREGERREREREVLNVNR